jgi:HK97 family phage portal protein
MVMGHQCLRGNAYVYKEMTEGGVINALYPMNPARMTVIRKPNTGKIVYRYAHEDGKTEDIPSDYIWHMKMYSNDGLVGMSPISYARESIGLGLAAEEYGSLFFSQNAKPSGILEYPGKLTEDSQALLKKSWEESYSGGNAHRTAILQQGLSWKQVGMDNQDAQYLELRQFQIEEICRIFRVPSFLIQHPDKTSTYASAEQQMLAFVMHTIRPWAVRIEQSISRCLLTDKERRKLYAEFKIEGLLKGDIKARYEAYAIARQWGWASPNDIRKLENQDPLPDGGDIYLIPSNMQDATKLPEQKPKGDDNGTEPET